MAKKLIKKFLPHPRIITNNRLIKLFGPRLQDPGLWHINRKSFCGAVAIGVFFSFIPVPFQMLLAAVSAIILRFNILVAVPLVWISNPVSMVPMFYFCYRIGAAILDIHTDDFNFELSSDWLLTELLEIWQPFLLGCLVVGLVAAIFSYYLMHFLWRYHLWTRIKNRRRRIRRIKNKLDSRHT
jgi:uncharacterized protein (DUF2062 family)